MCVICVCLYLCVCVHFCVCLCIWVRLCICLIAVVLGRWSVCVLCACVWLFDASVWLFDVVCVFVTLCVRLRVVCDCLIMFVCVCVCVGGLVCVWACMSLSVESMVRGSICV